MNHFHTLTQPSESPSKIQYSQKFPNIQNLQKHLKRYKCSRQVSLPHLFTPRNNEALLGITRHLVRYISTSLSRFTEFFYGIYIPFKASESYSTASESLPTPLGLERDSELQRKKEDEMFHITNTSQEKYYMRIQNGGNKKIPTIFLKIKNFLFCGKSWRLTIEISPVKTRCCWNWVSLSMIFVCMRRSCFWWRTYSTTWKANTGGFVQAPTPLHSRRA